MSAANTPCVETQMLIRKPVAVVFEAFIDPEQTRHFWFTKGSGKLEKGKTVTWQWEMYNFTTQAIVKDIVPNSRISVDWGEPATSVDFIFQPQPDDTTYVIIRNYGFQQEGAELLRQINDSTGGFTTVLDGCKAFLEHNINLNLIADKFPKTITSH